MANSKRPSYMLTDNTKKQVEQLRSLLSDGRMMTMKEIEVALDRKWVNGVIHHLELAGGCETVKDGRRVIGYRKPGSTKTVSDARPATVAPSVADAVAASVPRKKRVAALPVETETVIPVEVTEEVEETAPKAKPAPVKRKNVVREAVEKVYKPREVVVDWAKIEQETPEDEKHMIPPAFLRRT